MIEQEFTQLLREHPDLITDKKKFTGIVKDMLPGQSLQVNLLLTLFEMGIHNEIVRVSSITNAFAFRFVKQLVDERGVSRMNADWAVSVWCVCYGKNILRKPCEVKINTAKSGGQPSIVEERSDRKQYSDLFRYKKSQDGHGYAVTGFDGDNKKTLIFPSSYKNNSVISIAEGVFSESEIQEAVMTDGIKTIETRAFSGSLQLRQVIFPDTLIVIGDAAFSGCGGLHTAMLPKKVERIGAYAFAFTGLKSISIPESVYWLGEGAYSYCLGITSINIPRNVEQICDKLFEGCKALKKVTLPEKLITIGAKAFYGCEDLLLISVPDSVVEIGEGAFDGVNDKFILQCGAGTVAESYARKNKLNFQLT